MFFRDVLKRWSERPVDAASNDGGAVDACHAAPSLLEELATDPEDFADLAAVLELDLQAVITALVTEQPRTPAELVERLAARASLPAAEVRTAEPAAQPKREWVSLGGGGEVGWGRWMRVRGGTRIHRETHTPAVRPAMAPS